MGYLDRRASVWYTNPMIPNGAEFRVFASDEHGHSERVWARIQPRHDRQIEVVVNSRFFPYRSKGDLIRHALTRHLDWLDTLAPMPSTLRQVDAIMELMRDEEMHQDFKMVFDKLAEGVSKYRAAGDDEGAINLVSRVRAHIDRMPEGPWRDQYINEMDMRWGFLRPGRHSRLPRSTET